MTCPNYVDMMIAYLDDELYAEQNRSLKNIWHPARYAAGNWKNLSASIKSLTK